MIVCDPYNERAGAAWAALRAQLPDGWSPPEDVVVVVGGDGFLLHTVAEHGLEKQYLGMNAGTLGFLLNDMNDVAAVATALREHRWTTTAFPLLEADIATVDGQQHTMRAINDVYLERMTGRAARLTLTIDEHVATDQLVADGMIFATALGSTAYNTSAGGSPLHPTLRTLQVTPICPHRPRLSPFVLPPTARVEVEVQQHAWRPVRAVADGRGVDHVARVSLSLSSDVVRLAYLEGHDFTQQMMRKIVNP